MKKRILALVICFALMVCALPVQAADGDAYTRASFSMAFVDALGLEYTEDMAQELSDVSPNHEAYEAICIMLYHGQLVNYSGNSFRPDGTITRADAAVVLARALGLDNYSTDSLPADVPSTRYYAWSVAAALGEGLMSVDGSGNFRPNDNSLEGDIDFDKFASLLSADTTSSLTLDLINGSIEISQNWLGQYIYSQNGTETISTSNTCLIRQSDNSTPTANTIAVKSGNVKINLDGVNIHTTENYSSALKVEIDASLIVKIIRDNKLKTSGKYSSVICVPPRAEIIIDGGGSIDAIGGFQCAGIGNHGSYGKIIINGGTITATGGGNCAGIGGGYRCANGEIIINDGDVTAIGGDGAAGIGGGFSGNGGTITINGGAVHASVFSSNASGIGGGDGGNGGIISISNATITASGYFHSIGGGHTDNTYGCDKIDIGENVILNLEVNKYSGKSLCQERIDINTQPLNSAALSGNGAYAKTDAYGYSGIESYQWQTLAEDGITWSDIEGQTAAVASIPVSDGGTSYRCKITNVYGNVVYTDTVKAYTLAFTQQPQDANVEMGDIASLSVKSSCDNVTYRWERSYDGGETWSAVPGENYSVLIVDATLAENGALYRCVITATNGDELASDAALITVNTNAVTYTTEFYLENADGSYTLASREVLESEAGKSVTAAQRSFDHYIENSSRGTHSGVVTSDSGLVLSRYYERQSHTISFVTNGAGAIDGITAKWGTAVSLPDSLSRYGFVFGGWYMDAGLENEANISEMPTQDITLYAKWTAVGAGRGIEYKINSISVMDGDYQSCDSIPEGVFYAQVSVTNLESETMDTLVLAAYSAEGQMLGLYFLMADPMAGQTFNLGAMIDNSDGAIAELRAFMLPMLGGELIPLANSVCFK